MPKLKTFINLTISVSLELECN